ncbi:MAG: Gfo/Idh/MocA family protein [Acutalibacteraceae bacterium]|jgi:predicted dehydrogenase
MYKIGIIGYGSRMSDFVDRIMETGSALPVAIADPDQESVKKRAEKHSLKGIIFYSTAEEMLEKEKLNGICIGTRCSSHTHFALLAAGYGVPVFLEKPVATNEEDLTRLFALLNRNEQFLISFPLRFTKIVQCVKEIIDSGKIGTVQHVQAYNNVPYGRGYYHKWYRNEEETGGLFLQKSTHDFDYINYLLGDLKPVRICAMESKQIFKGSKPVGLMCKDCDERTTCPESPENVKSYGDSYIIGEYCCFAKDTGNHDSASVIIEYDTGMHVVYSQNFFVRKGAQKRGARLMGYSGTVEFDFNTGIVTVYHHNDEIVETYQVNQNGPHFGGDNILAKNFVDMMAKKASSRATLREGIHSADMCLKARTSAQEHRFVDFS